MSFRKVFVAVAALAALGVAAGAAFAQTSQQKALIDAAKAAGTVGEQASDGLLGFREPSGDPALTQAVQVTNDARRRAYAAAGAEAGTSAVVAGARMFETQLQGRISSGQYYRNTSGQWVRR